MPDPRHLLGRRAEKAVAAWLTANGWRVLEHRWRCADGELDLVCLDPADMLVGVEVKVRRSARAGSGAEALRARQVRRLRMALGTCARTRGLPHRAGTRIDLVELRPDAGGQGWRLRRYPVADAW